MTENAALAARRGSTWQLLATVTLDGGAGSQQQAVDRVTAALQEINLRPVQVEHIRQVVIEAASRAVRREREAQQELPVRIYVWTSGVHNHECGWGFFLVESQANEAPGLETQQVIELFLYQERKR